MLRENKVPYLGICLGMQLAIIEFARNVAGIKDATSMEFEDRAKEPVIYLIDDFIDANGQDRLELPEIPLGGTLWRLWRV